MRISQTRTVFFLVFCFLFVYLLAFLGFSSGCEEPSFVPGVQEVLSTLGIIDPRLVLTLKAIITFTQSAGLLSLTHLRIFFQGLLP